MKRIKIKKVIHKHELPKIPSIAEKSNNLLELINQLTEVYNAAIIKGYSDIVLTNNEYDGTFLEGYILEDDFDYECRINPNSFKIESIVYNFKTKVKNRFNSEEIKEIASLFPNMNKEVFEAYIQSNNEYDWVLLSIAIRSAHELYN